MPDRDFSADVLASEHVCILLALQAGASPEKIARDLRIGLDAVLAHIKLAGGAQWLTRGQARRVNC